MDRIRGWRALGVCLFLLAVAAAGCGGDPIDDGTQQPETDSLLATGRRCSSNAQCASHICRNHVCQPPTCTSGVSCTPANACHTGAISCSTGRPVCTDTGASLPNGTACGANVVCAAGACVACTAGAACVPSNVCHVGTISCSTGQPVCTDAGVQPDGTACGIGLTCHAGICGSP